MACIHYFFSGWFRLKIIFGYYSQTYYCYYYYSHFHLRRIYINYARDWLSTHRTKRHFSGALLATRSMRALQEERGARMIHADRARWFDGLGGLEATTRARARALLFLRLVWCEQVVHVELRRGELCQLLRRVGVVHVIVIGRALIVEQRLIDLLIIRNGAGRE